MKQISESEMLHRAAAYCSASERCIQDVEKKIKAAGLAGEESDRIVSRLLQERFIDESRFARYFVNDKLRFNKWGRVKINYEMQRKGIPSSIRSEALEGIDEQEYRSILLSLLKSKKKVTRGKDDREVYAKLLRFAAGRGFETRETSRCLKQLFNGNDYEDDFDGRGRAYLPALFESFALHAFYGYGDESGLSAFTGKNIFRRRHRSAPLHERGKRAKADPFLKISWKQKTRIRTGTHGCYHLPGDRAVRHRRSPFAGPAPPEKNEAKRL